MTQRFVKSLVRRSLDSHLLGRAWHEVMPGFLVVIGAAFSFTALIADYFSSSANRFSFGRDQIILLTAGIAAMVAGAALDVLLRNRTLEQTLKFWLVSAQVALLAVAFQWYRLENVAFYEFVMLLTLFGFIANHYLPQPLRLPFFLFISFAAFAGVFSVYSAAGFLWFVGLGLLLFGICHLPISMLGRVLAIVAVGTALAALRVGWVQAGWSGVVLPILTSMFMFRVFIYLYDISSGKGSKNIWHRLSYFFMLPNVVFPFFPVVDYATFGRTYYDQDANKIYQRGANWMFRGFIQLLLYRAIDFYFVLSPVEVNSPLLFLQYVVVNFGLYLRISGLFHLIIGMLLLFGFNLPETHKRYVFSSSFIDFWRRINIYWKDFMQKMVFNPCFVRFKDWGAPHMTSMVGAAFVVFFATWALHAYQWFWMRGTVLFTGPDVMFWTILALFLVAQTLYEARVSATAQKSGLFGPRTFLAIRTACTFLTICILWSLWTSESLSAWVDLWKGSGLLPALGGGWSASLRDWLVTIAVAGGVAFMAAVATGITFGLGPQGQSIQDQRQRQRKGDGSLVATSATIVVGTVVLLVLQIPEINARMGEDAQHVVRGIADTKLNRRDQALLQQGYYENVTNVNRFNTHLWEVLTTRPHEVVDIHDASGVRLRKDFLDYEFIPNASFVYSGMTYNINRWGMRDKDRELAKPPGTYRMAMMESSRGNGFGVKAEERFGDLLEEHLNKEYAGKKFSRYEVLNFSVDGYVPIQRLLALEEKVWKFEPDVVVDIAGPRELDNVLRIAKVYPSGAQWSYPFLDEIASKAGLRRSMTVDEVKRRLYPYRFELLSSIYKEMVAACRRRGVRAIWIYLPSPAPAWMSDEDIAEAVKLAKAAGFETLDLSTLFAKEDLASVQTGPIDNHPNVRGHRLIANAFFEGLGPLLGRPWGSAGGK